MTDEATVWRTFAALLPPAHAQEVMDACSIGEQESALDMVVSGLLAQDIPIGEDVRAQLAVTAEAWGQREALEERISQCRSADSERLSLRLVASADAVPLDGASLSSAPELAGLLVVPWIACVRCGRLLGRVHLREAWGDLSYLAAHHVLFHPGQAAQTAVFGPMAAQDALAVLTLCPGAQRQPALP
ncbi:hypothetical protein RKE29_03220 [Streptomyces sp. B1866]|uniref:hypothetical protein n=1 Tax=Streptomyces sp. B1866 TaxID=3075431 RepID=UPI00288DEBD6|nr:hypothetical protein [Streptomyces sp. B1866]MDT3395668.1 hypothetical protein [Streptomyces sp. B1866]